MTRTAKIALISVEPHHEQNNPVNEMSGNRIQDSVSFTTRL